MGKISDDRKSDTKYWTQFDESVESLHIDKLVLQNNKQEENRIKYLIQATVTRQCLIGFLWYDVYQFFKTGYDVNIKTFETDDFNELIAQSNNLNSNQNLCIFEFKECNDASTRRGEQLMKQVGLIAVVINNNLDKQYRLNYIYKKVVK